MAITREINQVIGDRLIALILLISFAYCLSTFNGKSLQLKWIANYVTRPTEPGRTYRRHSSFSIGLHGPNWVDSIAFFQDIVQELLRFSTGKNDYYRFWYEGCFSYTVCFMTFSVVPAEQ